MTDAEKYVAVFRAAARGVMEPYPPPVFEPGAGSDAIILSTYREEDRSRAQSMAGAFKEPGPWRAAR